MLTNVELKGLCIGNIILKKDTPIVVNIDTLLDVNKNPLDYAPLVANKDTLRLIGIDTIGDNPKEKHIYNDDLVFKILEFEFTNTLVWGNGEGFCCWELKNNLKKYRYIHEIQNLYNILNLNDL